MYYQWEWLSDLAIIPAWECFLAGVALGIIVTLAVIAWAGWFK
jgi:hypothetical protein